MLTRSAYPTLCARWWQGVDGSRLGGITMAGAGKALVLGPREGRSIDLGAFGMTVKADRFHAQSTK